MYKIYFLLITICLISCNTKIRYIGKTLLPTKDIEIFISEQSIKRPFEYIGKGYLSRFGISRPEKIQIKAENLGREKGADAILITDFYIQDNGGTSISSSYRTDSIAHGVITSGSTTVTPTSTSGYNIFFIKYIK